MGNAAAVKILATESGWGREERPACSIYDEFAFDVSTPAEQQTYAMLLQAQTFTGAGRIFEVYDTGACTITGDRENIRLIYMCRAPE